MEAIAKLNNAPFSPRKMRLVADMVRGKQVRKALSILKFEPKQGAKYLHKLLLSAVANWEAKNPGSGSEMGDLVVKTIFVDGGRSLKRVRPAPQGRAYRIQKRSNHITVVVDVPGNRAEVSDIDAITSEIVNETLSEAEKNTESQNQ